MFMNSCPAPVNKGHSKVYSPTKDGPTVTQAMPPTNDKQDGPVAMLVGPNFRVGKKIGSGNFGEIRLGKKYKNM